MKLTDCVDWQQATITAMRRYDEIARAVYVLSDQIKRREENNTAPGVSNISSVPLKGGANRTEERWVANMEETRALRENLRDCRAFLKQVDFAWEKLPDTDKRILQVRFRSRMSPTQAIVSLMDELGYEKTRIYDLSKIALERLTHMLFGA